MVAAVLTDRAFSRQPKNVRNLADNLSKMSDKTNSEAVIGQFKSLFRKRIADKYTVN